MCHWNCYSTGMEPVSHGRLMGHEQCSWDTWLSQEACTTQHDTQPRVFWEDGFCHKPKSREAPFRLLHLQSLFRTDTQQAVPLLPWVVPSVLLNRLYVPRP